MMPNNKVPFVTESSVSFMEVLPRSFRMKRDFLQFRVGLHEVDSLGQHSNSQSDRFMVIQATFQFSSVNTWGGGMRVHEQRIYA